MVDGAGDDQTRLHACEFSGLEDGTDGLASWVDADGWHILVKSRRVFMRGACTVVVRLHTTSKGGSRGGRIRDKVIAGESANIAEDLQDCEYE